MTEITTLIIFIFAVILIHTACELFMIKVNSLAKKTEPDATKFIEPKEYLKYHEDSHLRQLQMQVNVQVKEQETKNAKLTKLEEQLNNIEKSICELKDDSNQASTNMAVILGRLSSLEMSRISGPFDIINRLSSLEQSRKEVVKCLVDLRQVEVNQNCDIERDVFETTLMTGRKRREI